MISGASYVQGIWKARYFWTHLALADIRVKYRRSSLGLTWAILQPLALTLLLAFVMGKIFHAEVHDYAPYIFSGLIIWEFLVSSAVTGCNAFVNAEGYIKQFTHPLAIFTLRSVIPCMINLICAFIGLLCWAGISNPHNFGFSWITLLPSFVFLFIFAWPLATITAFIGVRFRDFQQMIMILLQIIYYVSPIFFLPDMFIKANIGYLLDYNPIYHILNLFRFPLLHGQWPLLLDYLYLLIFSLVLWLFAYVLIRRHEKRIIFYL